MAERVRWTAPDLSIRDEPLMVSLLRYRRHKDRWRDDTGNLVSSLTPDGRHMPVLDLDFPHRAVPSSTPGHTHLYLDVPISRFRWAVLMAALKYAGVIELGFFVWSLRRGANFVRDEAVTKTTPAEKTKPTYGWFFKTKGRPYD